MFIRKDISKITLEILGRSLKHCFRAYKTPPFTALSRCVCVLTMIACALSKIKVIYIPHLRIVLAQGEPVTCNKFSTSYRVFF